MCPAERFAHQPGGKKSEYIFSAGNLALNDDGMAAERTGLARTFSLLNGRAYGLDTEVPHP